MERRRDRTGRARLTQPARAEESFTISSTGASWGEGLRASFVEAPKFEEKNGIKVTQEFGIDSALTAKAMAGCGNPPFSTSVGAASGGELSRSRRMSTGL